MDEKTRERALNKTDSIRAIIGYPDFLADKQGLDKYYNRVSKHNKLTIWKNSSWRMARCDREDIKDGTYLINKHKFSNSFEEKDTE